MTSLVFWVKRPKVRTTLRTPSRRCEPTLPPLARLAGADALLMAARQSHCLAPTFWDFFFLACCRHLRKSTKALPSFSAFPVAHHLDRTKMKFSRGMGTCKSPESEVSSNANPPSCSLLLCSSFDQPLDASSLCWRCCCWSAKRKVPCTP